MLSSRSDIFFNVQGQRHIVRSKLLEDILFGLKDMFLEYMLMRIIWYLRYMCANVFYLLDFKTIVNNWE